MFPLQINDPNNCTTTCILPNAFQHRLDVQKNISSDSKKIKAKGQRKMNIN